MIDPHYAADGTRCVIVKPGDVLVLAGSISESATAALQKVKDELGLSHVIICESLDAVKVRDFDIELDRAIADRDGVRNLLEAVNTVNEQLHGEIEELSRQLRIATRPAEENAAAKGRGEGAR